MQRNRFILLGAISVAALAAVIGIILAAINNGPERRLARNTIIEPVAPVERIEPVADVGDRVDLASGNFIAAEGATSGAARIVKEGVASYLELDPTFRTLEDDEELKILLAREGVPPRSYTDIPAERYIEIAPLQANRGAQRYPIPNNVDLNDYESVVILSARNDANVGYAPLRPAEAPAAVTAQAQPVPVPTPGVTAPAALW